MKIELGNNMYLFLSSGRINRHAERLVISAHGGIRRIKSPTFNIPAQYQKIQFYSDHGESTTDFGLSNFGQGNTSQMKEALKGGDECYNYSLYKYQGKHNEAGETYNSIELYQGFAVKSRKQQLDKLMAGQNLIGGQTLSSGYDVLTIRNRIGSAGIKFEDVLDNLQNTWRYEEIHCYFCRSFFL